MRAFFVLALLGGCSASTASKTPEELGQEGLAFWPPEAGRGTTFDARVTSGTSIFDFESDDLTLGDGVTVNSLTVLDGWTAAANLTVDPAAPLGAQDAHLTTHDGNFTIGHALTIVDDSFAITPNRARIGESVQVEFVGQNTEWKGGATWANFGDGLDVTAVDVFSDNYMVATVTVADSASPGLRDVAVDTGPDVATMYGGFQVDRVALTASFDPTEVSQGQTVSYTIIGDGTHFKDGDTELSFWQSGDEKGDITVDSMTVLDAENLYGTMTVSNAAELGFRDVLVTTKDEGAFIEDAFNVNAGELDLSQVGISLWFDVSRSIDNGTGAISEYVSGGAIFYLPLDPPCPPDPEANCTDTLDNDRDAFTDCNDTDCAQDPACGGGPMPYDANGYWQTYSQGGSADCPANTTVGAGEHVWFESACNIVTLDRQVDGATGMIYYTADLTLADYCFDQAYDLHTEGEEGGIGEELLVGVQPTVPADFSLLVPGWWNNYTHSRAEDLTYTWTPAQTYPDAIFFTSISGQLVAPEGAQGYAGALPWDDGEHTYTPAELGALKAGPATFTALSQIKGPYFGFPWSTIQSNQSSSTLSIQGSVVLE